MWLLGLIRCLVSLIAEDLGLGAVPFLGTHPPVQRLFRASASLGRFRCRRATRAVSDTRMRTLPGPSVSSRVGRSGTSWRDVLVSAPCAYSVSR